MVLSNCQFLAYVFIRPNQEQLYPFILADIHLYIYIVNKKKDKVKKCMSSKTNLQPK